MSSSISRYVAFFMWLFPLLFFAYQFILRLWPGLMMPQIMQQFAIDASSFGIMASFYYYGYAGMQLPVAMLLDKFGPRIIVAFFAILCGVGTLIFTYTDNFYLAVLSRFLIGVGSAVGFLGVSKVVSEWFRPEEYGKMIGFSFTFGLMGAIYGGRPISLLIDAYSWQKVALTLALISVFLGLATYFFLRSPKLKNEDLKQHNSISDSSGVLEVILSPTILWLAIANFLMVGALEGFADVWGVQYLITAYNLEKADAASFTSLIFVGMLFGGPLLAFLSRKMGQYFVIMACAIGLALAFALLILMQHYNSILLSSVFFVIGIMCCYQVIVFAAGSDLVPAKSLGITIAFLNCMNMLGGSFFHSVIGKIMDIFWQGAVDQNNVKIYSLEAYQYSLSLIPICAVIGGIIVYFIGTKAQNKINDNLVLGNSN